MVTVAGPGPARFPRSWAAALSVVATAAAARAETGQERELEVVVRGAPRHPSAAPKDRGVAGSVIGRERLRQPGVGVADALRSQVGVQISELGGFGAPATAAIRGATAAQVPVYFGGVRLNDEVSGVADLGTVPVWLLDRVEVYRGNAPIEADRLGIGGAIFLEPLGPERAGSGAGVMAGSWNSRAAWAFASSRSEQLALLVGVRGEASDNDYEFFDDRGTHFVPEDGGPRARKNTDTELFDVWLLGRARTGESELDLLVHHVQREQGAPKLALVPSRSARSAMTRSLFAIESRTPLGESASWIEAQTALVDSSAVISDPEFELAMRTGRLLTRGERVAQRVAARLEPAPWLLVRPAIDASVERLRRFEGGFTAETPVLVAHRHAARQALGAELRPAQGFAVRSVTALECFATRTTGQSGVCDRIQPAGRAGVLAGTSPFELYANAARYVREPTLGELYGASLAVRGNPRLESELGWTVDAGVRWLDARRDRSLRAWCEIAAFSRWASRLVSYLRTSEGYLVPVNLRSARVMGIELDAGASFAECCQARLSVSATDPRDTSSGRRTLNPILPFHSRLVAVPAIRAELRPVQTAVRRAALEVRYVFQSSRYADPAGLAVIPAQGSLDVEASVELSPLIGRARLANLLDQARFDVVGFPLPGRSVFASLEVTW